MRRLLSPTVLAALALLALPAAALAHSRHHHHAKPAVVKLWSTSQILALALWDAEEYWQGPGSHVAPCGGDVRFVAAQPFTLSEGQRQAIGGPIGTPEMWTTWTDSVGGVEYSWGEGAQYTASNFRNCAINYDAEWLGGAEHMLRWWPELAQGVAHELEHLENRWWIETPVDGGNVPLSAVPRSAVNYPAFTCQNEPPQAERFRPPGAATEREITARSSCDQ